MLPIFSDHNFQKEVLEHRGLVLVDFWAEWCGPCHMFGPIIEKVNDEVKSKDIKIGKINIDENQKIPSTYSIMSIPTLIFFKNGQMIDQMVGVHSKEKVIERIEKHRSTP